MKTNADIYTNIDDETAVMSNESMVFPLNNRKLVDNNGSGTSESKNPDACHNSSEEEEIGVVLRPKRTRVSFGAVSCRLYERTIGNHPDVSSGPPLAFSWNFYTAPDMPLEEYEALQGKKLTRTQLIIPKRQRTKILIRECGLSKTSIASIVRQVNRCRAQRMQTIQTLKFSKIEEKLQSVRKGISKMLFLRKSHEAQVKQMWKDAEEYLEKSLSSTTNLTCSSTSIRSNLKVLPKENESRTSQFCQHQQQFHDDLDRARHNKYPDHTPEEYLFPKHDISRFHAVDDNTCLTPKFKFDDDCVVDMDQARHGKVYRIDANFGAVKDVDVISNDLSDAMRNLLARGNK